MNLIKGWNLARDGIYHGWNLSWDRIYKRDGTYKGMESNRGWNLSWDGT